MIRIPRRPTGSIPSSALLLLVFAGCLPSRTEGPDERILEPEWNALPAMPARPDAVEIHIHPIRARSNISTSLQYRKPTGEIQTDPIWSWSVAPNQYLSEVLDLVACSDASIRLTDSARNLSLQVELIFCGIEEGPGGPAARVSILARVRGADRRVQVLELEKRSPLDGEMPRSLSRAMGTCIVAVSRAALAETRKRAR